MCEHSFGPKLAACPDGKIGCLVAHYDKHSWICTECGYDAAPEVAKAIMEGRIDYVEGPCIINLNAIFKLEFND